MNSCRGFAVVCQPWQPLTLKPPNDVARKLKRSLGWHYGTCHPSKSKWWLKKSGHVALECARLEKTRQLSKLASSRFWRGPLKKSSWQVKVQVQTIRDLWSLLLSDFLGLLGTWSSQKLRMVNYHPQIMHTSLSYIIPTCPLCPHITRISILPDSYLSISENALCNALIGILYSPHDTLKSVEKLRNLSSKPPKSQCLNPNSTNLKSTPLTPNPKPETLKP